MSLLFSVAELRNEVDAFNDLARDFLAGASSQVLRALVDQLAGISRSATGARWSISRENPVVTQPSVGHYMPGGQGGLTVHAQITFVWDLQPVRPAGDSRAAKLVRLNGLASTEIRVLAGDPWQSTDRELAVWRMEIGDAAAPGAKFHVQVLGRDGDAIFPKALDIPRLPGVLPTPFACMEFVLGELFQDEWPRVAVKDSAAGRQWRGIQAERHLAHLRWVSEVVSSTSGSPWVAWKKAHPDERLFAQA